MQKPMTIKIADRINLNIIQESKFKTNYLSIDFLCRISKETAALNALLVRVLKRGTAKYPDIASLNEALDTLYASSIYAKVFKTGDIQSFGFSSFPLDNSYATDGCDILGGVIGILHDMIFDPYTEDGMLSDKYVESEKHSLCDQIRAQKNNKDAWAIQRCIEEMSRGDDYAIPSTGDASDVEKITAESLTEYYRKVFESAPAEIYFIGRCDPEKLADTFREFFNGLKRTPSSDISTVPQKAPDSPKEICDSLPVNQSKLCMGFYTGYTLFKDGYEKFALFCEIFGGSPVAKLFINVREKLSLCYYCQAMPEGHKGFMLVASGIENENKQIAQDEIIAQLEKCRNGEISEEELLAAKKSIISSYTELNDDPEAIKSWYFSRSVAGRCDSPEDAAEAVRKLEINDAIEAARNIKLDTVYFLSGTGSPDGSDTDSDGGEADE